MSVSFYKWYISIFQISIGALNATSTDDTTFSVFPEVRKEEQVILGG